MKTKLVRFSTTYWWVFVVLILNAGFFSACSSSLGEHIARYQHLRAYAEANGEERDYSRRRTSGNSLYQAAFQPKVDPIPLNQLHSWTLYLETPDGRPVEGATITVDGGMPEHGHGLPTKPQVTRSLGGGDYLVEGMKFQMPGWWVVQFKVTSPEGSDTVSFNLSL
ncbi:MAG TPA: FixH family protein [Rhodothermales bacterium]|nr:FixH family protein [Rhodothermales bacterium]